MSNLEGNENILPCNSTDSSANVKLLTKGEVCEKFVRNVNDRAKDSNSNITTDSVPDQPRSLSSDFNNTSVESPNNKEEEFGSDCKFVHNEENEEKPNASFKAKKKVPPSANLMGNPFMGQAPMQINIVHGKNIHFGNTVNFNSASSDTSAKRVFKKAKPKEFEFLMSSSKPVTEDTIDCVTSHIGLRWKEVGRKLKYTDGQMEQFEHDHKVIKEIVYQLLLDWKRVNTSSATIGKLSKALWSAEQFDALKQLLKPDTTD